MLIRTERCFLCALFVFFSVFCMANGCGKSEDQATEAILPSKAPNGAPSATEGLIAKQIPRDDGPNETTYPELHNLLKLTDTIYSGGEPQGDEAFASIARLGVRIVVSVDGAKPNLEAARKHGLRYVHVPVGYDGIESEAGLALARLVRETDGPFYIHCHHGRHRGPAAAAVACVAAGEVNGKNALAILERAGTGKEYAGLWRDVENYVAPGNDVELPALVEVATVGSFAAAMSQVDRAYDDLKLCREAGWATPADHPDLVPAQQALLMKEGLRESARNLAADHSAQFKIWLAEAEGLAAQIEDDLRKTETSIAGEHFQSLEQSCKQCHASYRN